MGRISSWEIVGDALSGGDKKSRAQKPTQSVYMHFADEVETVICRCVSSEHRHNKRVRDEVLVERATEHFRKHPDEYQCAPTRPWSKNSRSQRSNSANPRLG
jgi:hypothetical protein